MRKLNVLEVSSVSGGDGTVADSASTGSQIGAMVGPAIILPTGGSIGSGLGGAIGGIIGTVAGAVKKTFKEAEETVEAFFNSPT